MGAKKSSAKRSPSCSFHKILARLERMLGDQVSVLVIQQVGILMFQAEDGGRLGRDDGVPLADGVRQQTHVLAGDLSGTLQVARRDSRHAAGRLGHWHVETDAVLLQDLRERATDVWIMMIGVQIDEVRDFQAAMGQRFSPTATGGMAEKRFAKPPAAACVRRTAPTIARPSNVRLCCETKSLTAWEAATRSRRPCRSAPSRHPKRVDRWWQRIALSTRQQSWGCRPKRDIRVDIGGN